MTTTATILILSGVFAVLVTADQLLKLWAVAALSAGNIPLIDGVLELTLVYNKGAAWGILQGGGWLFAVVTLFVCAVGIYAMLRVDWFKGFLPRLFITLIIAGGIGNLIDRLFRPEGVVDYIYVRAINFPVFNLADCCVTCGMIALLITLLFSKEPAAKHKPLADGPTQDQDDEQQPRV